MEYSQDLGRMVENAEGKPRGVMDHVSADIFEFGGKKHLLLVDALSRYPFVMPCTRGRVPTTKTVVMVEVSKVFRQFGWPSHFKRTRIYSRSDRLTEEDGSQTQCQ